MITTLVGISYRILLASKSKIIISVIIVALAIGLVSTVTLLIDKMSSSFQREVKLLYGDTDVMIGFRNEEMFNKNQTKLIENKPEVIDTSYVLVNPILGQDFYYVGVDNSFLSKGRYKFSHNIVGNEVILSNSLARKLDASVNKEITLNLNNIPNTQWVVKEIIQDSASSVAPDIAIFSIGFLQDTLGLEGMSNLILIKLTPETNIHEFIKNIQYELAISFDSEILSESDFIKENVQSLRVMALIVSLISIILAAALIFSNFRMIMFEYIHQLIILQTNGANNSQIYKIILFNLAVVLIIGGGLSFGTTYLLNLISPRIINEIFGMMIGDHYFDGVKVLIITISCLFLIFLLLILPLRQSINLLPISNIAELHKREKKESNFSNLVFYILIILGVCIQIIAVFGQAAVFFVIGGLLITLGIYMGISFLFQVVIKYLIFLSEKKKGKEIYLAFQYLLRYYKQNVLIILVLAVSINIPIIGFSLFGTIKNNMELSINNEYVSDLIIYNNKRMMSEIPLTLSEQVNDIDGVEDTIPISTFQQVGSGEESFNYMFTNLNEMVQQGLIPTIQGDVSRSVILNREYAKKMNLSLGDKLYFAHNSEKLIVSAIEDHLPGASNVKYVAFVDISNTLLPKQNEYLFTLLINIDEDKEEVVLTNLEYLSKQYPKLKYSSKRIALNEMNQLINQRYLFVFAIVFVSIFICLIGIYLTLKTFILSKNRDFAILSTLGMSKSQNFRIIVTQSIFFCILSSIIGVITGLILSYSVMLALESTVVIYPWFFILIVIVFLFLYALITAIILTRDLFKKNITERLIIQ